MGRRRAALAPSIRHDINSHAAETCMCCSACIHDLITRPVRGQAVPRVGWWLRAPGCRRVCLLVFPQPKMQVELLTTSAICNAGHGQGGLGISCLGEPHHPTMHMELDRMLSQVDKRRAQPASCALARVPPSAHNSSTQVTLRRWASADQQPVTAALPELACPERQAEASTPALFLTEPWPD